MMKSSDSYDDMLTAIRGFHELHRFRETGGEDMVYRIALMSEELGEISACVTKGKLKENLSEELADLFILVIGSALSADIDLKGAFWKKIDILGKRTSRTINGRIRVSEFRDSD